MITVMLILCAWITIPAPIPFTMQNFAIYLSLLLTGGRCTTIALSVYILLGIAGVPVFSSFGSSVGYLLGPTGGYIIGFVLCSLLYFLSEKTLNTKENSTIKLLTLTAGTLLCYLAGSLWFMCYTGMPMSFDSFLQVLSICVLPYIISDGIKLILAYFLSKKLAKAINTKN